MERKQAYRAFVYWGDRIYTPLGEIDKKAEIMRSLWAWAYDTKYYKKLPRDPIEADNILWEKYLNGELKEVIE